MHMRMHMEQKQNSEDDGVMLETFKVLYFSEPDSPELLVILKEMPKGYSLEKEFHGIEAREMYLRLKGEHDEC